jgi:uncharacterized spore protein YtfJ
MSMVDTTAADSSFIEMLRNMADNATVRTVFGEPVTEEGVTLVPVAKVSGGAGGGGGTGPDQKGQEAHGTGGGLGLSARPVGAYVIRDGRVSWRPAIDVNRVILGGQVVAVVALLTIRALFRRHRS